MAFSDEFIAELRRRNEICELVGHYVRLKGNGRTMVGLCPFHNEKTPSFVVYPDTQSVLLLRLRSGRRDNKLYKGN